MRRFNASGAGVRVSRAGSRSYPRPSCSLTSSTFATLPLQSFADGNDTDLHENFVMIRHADGTVARYLHLRRGGALVAVGVRVEQGQRIAYSGNSGQTGGPHLHFDVQQCGPNLPPAYNALPCEQTVPVNIRNTGSNACGLVPGQRYRVATPSTRPAP